MSFNGGQEPRRRSRPYVPIQQLSAYSGRQWHVDDEAEANTDVYLPMDQAGVRGRPYVRERRVPAPLHDDREFLAPLDAETAFDDDYPTIEPRSRRDAVHSAERMYLGFASPSDYPREHEGRTAPRRNTRRDFERRTPNRSSMRSSIPGLYDQEFDNHTASISASPLISGLASVFTYLLGSIMHWEATPASPAVSMPRRAPHPTYTASSTPSPRSPSEVSYTEPATRTMRHASGGRSNGTRPSNARPIRMAPRGGESDVHYGGTNDSDGEATRQESGSNRRQHGVGRSANNGPTNPRSVRTDPRERERDMHSSDATDSDEEATRQESDGNGRQHDLVNDLLPELKENDRLSRTLKQTLLIRVHAQVECAAKPKQLATAFEAFTAILKKSSTVTIPAFEILAALQHRLYRGEVKSDNTGDKCAVVRTLSYDICTATTKKDIAMLLARFAAVMKANDHKVTKDGYTFLEGVTTKLTKLTRL